MFLGDSGERTLFSIDCQTGVKIQHLSAYSAEAEVYAQTKRPLFPTPCSKVLEKDRLNRTVGSRLIAAGTRFVVSNTITTGDLTVVNLKEVGSGLPAPEDIPPEPQPQPAVEPEPAPAPAPAPAAPINSLAALAAATGEVRPPPLRYRSEVDLF